MKFKASKEQIEKLKIYLKHGKNNQPIKKGIRNNSDGTPSNK
jgi:hypothetical protein